MNKILSIIGIFFFLNAGNGVVGPYLQLFLQNKGFRTSEIGFLLSSFQLAGIIGPVIWASIAAKNDDFTKPILLSIALSLICLSISYVLPGLFFLVLPFIFIYGLCHTAQISLSDSLITMNLSNPAKNYGKIRIAGCLGFSISALISRLTGLVKDDSNFTILMGICFYFSIYGFFILIFHIQKKKTIGVEEKNSNSLKTKSNINNLSSLPPVFWIGMLVIFFNTMGISLNYNFFSIFLKHRFHLESVAGLWAVGPFVEIPFFFFSGHIFSRFKLTTVWTFCLILGIIQLLLYSMASSILSVYLIRSTTGINFALFHASCVGFVRKHSSSHNRGVAMGIYSAIEFGLAISISGFISGIIIENFGFEMLFQSFIIFFIIALFFNWYLNKKENGSLLKIRN